MAVENKCVTQKMSEWYEKGLSFVKWQKPLNADIKSRKKQQNFLSWFWEKGQSLSDFTFCFKVKMTCVRNMYSWFKFSLSKRKQKTVNRTEMVISCFSNEDKVFYLAFVP